MCFVTGAQILCTVLLIKPGAWSHRLARILQKIGLEKFTVVAMKHVHLEPDIALGLLSSEVKQVCYETGRSTAMLRFRVGKDVS